jgi:hypothetical protein
MAGDTHKEEAPMPRYKAGVVGPIPLEDGRVVTAEDGPFDLDVASVHDQDLLDRGAIVGAEEASTSPELSTKRTSKGGD